MRKVKYIGNVFNYDNLTKGSVYDVIDYISDGKKGNYDMIHIMVDGEMDFCYISDIDYKPLFIDVTVEYRNGIIDEILN